MAIGAASMAKRQAIVTHLTALQEIDPGAKKNALLCIVEVFCLFVFPVFCLQGFLKSFLVLNRYFEVCPNIGMKFYRVVSLNRCWRDRFLPFLTQGNMGWFRLFISINLS